MCIPRRAFVQVTFLSGTLAIGAVLLASCAQVQATEDAVCARIAAMSPTALAILDAQDPHGVVGNLWAYQKSACVNGLPAPGVSTGWASMIWGELKVLIPQLLPMVVGLL